MKAAPTLSRLLVGVDVPWVTAWSEERQDGVRPCASVGGRLAVFQHEHAGYGRPIYSANHFVRQRRSVMEMLCPMCGAATDAGDRWTLTARPTRIGALRERGLGHLLPDALPNSQQVLNAGAIAPLHRGCADRSAGECPHLRADPGLELRAFPERWLVVPLWVEAHAESPAGAILKQPAEPVAVVGFLQLLGIGVSKPQHRRLTARSR